MSARGAVLAVLVVTGAAGARADTYALLPARGDAFTPVLREVDKSSRAALVHSGVDLQPQDVTDKQLSDLFSSGVTCTDPAADDCALRIGLAAGVDVVVAQTVTAAGARLLLRVSAVSTSDGKARHIYGELVLQDGGASVASAVARLLGKTAPATPVPVTVHMAPSNAALTVDDAPSGLDDGRLWLVPGRHRVAVTAAGYPALTTDIDVGADALATFSWTLPGAVPSAVASTTTTTTTTAPTSGLSGPSGQNGAAASAATSAPAPLVSDAPAPMVSRAAASVDVAALRPGLIVAGAGGALFVLGVAAALGTEVVLGDRLHPDARQSALLAGRLALVVAGVGVVGAGVGGALLAVE